jgi:hypothetical protein
MTLCRSNNHSNLKNEDFDAFWSRHLAFVDGPCRLLSSNVVSLSYVMHVVCCSFRSSTLDRCTSDKFCFFFLEELQPLKSINTPQSAANTPCQPSTIRQGSSPQMMLQNVKALGHCGEETPSPNLQCDDKPSAVKDGPFSKQNQQTPVLLPADHFGWTCCLILFSL